MPETECKLIWYSWSGHLQQVFTGFLMLHKRGLIRLSQHCSKEPIARSTEQHLKTVGGAHLRVLMNGSIKVHYDYHDAVEINEQHLEECDFYFKRSFSREYIGNFPKHKDKVFPLGLYYRVFPDSVDLYSIQRALIVGRGLTGKLRSLIHVIDAKNTLTYNPRLRQLESLPNYDLPPRVLFLAAAHDPYAHADRTQEKTEEMICVNETRAKCIQVLRKELGPRFFGGFIHNPYAIKTYRELLVHDHDVTRKRNYIGLLRAFPICIATTGLHGSIGAKFGEYVALSRAIVSEKLNYEVPGNLQAGRNYLEFASPDECAERSVRLIEDRDTRNRLMLNNALYYQSNLRPDSLVLNSLLKAFSKTYLQSSQLPAQDLGQEKPSLPASYAVAARYGRR
jgi:hypothetical protein